MMKIITRTLSPALGATLVAASLATLTTTVHATEFSLGNGWRGSVGLQIQAFVVDLDDDASDESSSRVQSGFDPSKLTIGVVAPEHNGITVSGTFQAVQSIQGAKDQGDGSTDNFGVRIAQVSIAGDFGTLKFGRDVAIFGLSSLAHDTGSLPGVGRGGSIDGGGATAGRINYGYYYPDFHAGVQYTSNSFNGLSFTVGLFDPINGRSDQSDDLRFEAAVNYNSEQFDLWASVIDQSTEGDDELTGFDIGGEVRLGALALTAAFSDGTGINCCSPDTDDLEQWYIEADYQLGKTTLGVSYGENEITDRDGAGISDGELTMLFVHHKLTPTLTLIGEWNNETVSPAGGGSDTTDADTIAFGVNWQF